MTKGAYRFGNSFLHRTDPRVKLLLLIGLVACLFSAANPQRLILIACLWFAAAGSTTRGLNDIWRILRLMRWLLLFTLLLHLLFTPGRTLFGTSWLSYDGLLRGLMVNSQIFLAILFSLLLSWTTRPTALAWGLTALLSPLQRLKVPVKETCGLLLLVLHFFPLIQEEVESLKVERKKKNPEVIAGLKGWIRNIEPLLARLFDRADQLAKNIASGTETIESVENQERFIFDHSAWIIMFFGILGIFLLWQV